MGWKKVTVEQDGQSQYGMMREPILEVGNFFEIGDTVMVNKKNYKVESYDIDERDDLLIIKLADASPKKKGAKNGESPKGSDKDKPSE